MAEKTNKEIYTKLTHIQHILTRPDTYIGNIVNDTIDLYTIEDINNLDNIKISKREINYNAGFIKIFDEIICNAADHCSRKNKINGKNIKVEIKNNTISVYNDGSGIPIELFDENIYYPELLFAHLLTGQNFDDTEDRTTAGRNGYGAKLTNIYSTEFIVETADGKNYYKQTFKDNLTANKTGKFTKPTIIPSKDNFTRITYTPDYVRFGMSELTDDLISIMIKRVVDIAAYNPNINVYYNDNLISIKNYKDYIRFYTISDEDEILYEKINENFEIGIIKSNYDGFEQSSIVNATATTQGGSHVNFIINNITNKLKPLLSKGNKYNINVNDIKSKMFLFINCKIVNPEFSAQTKEYLTSKTSSFQKDLDISDGFIKKLMKSDITKEIIDLVEMKEQLALKKAINNKPSKNKVKKLNDAANAGTKYANQCALILGEGDSAIATCIRGISALDEKTRKFYGTFPLKGKPLNIRNVPISKIIANEEIKSILSALGLVLNKKYTDTSELRYGKLIVMADADVDGTHITALIMNILDVFFPELLRMDFLYQFVTPIIRAVKNKDTKYFYKFEDYNIWKDKPESKGYNIKYFKGLGTINNVEAKLFFSNIDNHLIPFKFRGEEKTRDVIDMVFNKNRADERKTWLMNYKPNIIIDKFNNDTYYDTYINEELIEFSMSDNIRSIPSAIDGLKPVQRKALYTIMNNNYKFEEKVSIISGSIIAATSYHHGGVSLENTIINMAQDYIGSNNINLLEPSGEFGSRSCGGDDASSARYVFSRLMPVTKFIFNIDDNLVLDYKYDDGIKIEPAYFVPIIPMVLINGANGIGTGWSTDVCKYNIIDIIEYIEKILNNKKPKKNIEPYYRGFKGVIEKQDKRYVTYGKFERIKGNKLIISELPIGLWNNDFYEILDKLIDEKKINDYIKNSTDTDINITVIFNKGVLEIMTDEDVYKMFKLTTNLNMTNMNLFDRNEQMKLYDDIYEIIDEHMNVRLQYYDKRKTDILSNLRNDINILENRIKFINLIINKKLNVNNKSKELIISDIEKNKILKINDSYDYLLNMSLYSLTMEKVEDFNLKLKEKNELYILIENKSNIDIWKEELSILKKEAKKYV